MQNVLSMLLTFDPLISEALYSYILCSHFWYDIHTPIL